MRVLGVDPGSRLCGYGVVDVDGAVLRYVECGVVTAPARWPMEERLAEVARGLAEVIGELAPEVVAVESVYVHKNPRSALALAQARGVVLAVAGLRSLSVSTLQPSMIKKAVTGRGCASKEQVAAMVARLLGMRTLPRIDASDALAVAMAQAMQRLDV